MVYTSEMLDGAGATGILGLRRPPTTLYTKGLLYKPNGTSYVMDKSTYGTTTIQSQRRAIVSLEVYPVLYKLRRCRKCRSHSNKSMAACHTCSKVSRSLQASTIKTMATTTSRVPCKRRQHQRRPGASAFPAVAVTAGGYLWPQAGRRIQRCAAARTSGRRSGAAHAAPLHVTAATSYGRKAGCRTQLCWEVRLAG